MCLVAALALILPAPHVLAGTPKIVWAKIGAPSSAMEIDFSACIEESRKLKLHPQSSVPVGPFGMLIGDLMAPTTQFPKERADFIRTCMFGRGYHAVRLLPDEEMDLNAVKTDEASAQWAERFYGRGDFAQRLAAASPPPLSEANNEPLTYGAIRFDPALLVPASGIIKAGNVVLAGRVSHRRTAQLAVDAEVRPDGYDTRIPAGTVLHEAVFPDEDGTNKTYWCGSFRTVAGFIDDMCARNGQNGFVLLHPEGAHWIATGLDTHGNFGFADRDTFDLIESPTDLAGEIDFAMAVRKISRTSIILEAVVNHGSDYETLWKKTLPLDSSGTVVLPFWTHRLVLTSSGDGIHVTFPADGDGTGWPYQAVDR
jgi:hypothetical protein